MLDRRNETRLLCADLIQIGWKEGAKRKTAFANLEDISGSGACVQMETPVPLDSVIVLAHPEGELTGKVRYCTFREIGYFVGVEFDPGQGWSQRKFKPQHLLDPRRLTRSFRKAKTKRRG